MKALSRFYEEHAKMFAPLGFVPASPRRRSRGRQARRLDAAGVPKVDHYVGLGSWFAGTPDDLVRAAEADRGKLSRHGACDEPVRHPLTTPKALMLEQFQMVAEEVNAAFPPTPAVRDAAK